MNSINKKKERQRMIDILVQQTGFKDKFVIENILKIHKDYIPKGSKFDRQVLRQFLGTSFQMTDEMLMDRVFKVFDKDNDGKLSEEEFVRGLSVIFYGDLTEHANFAFDVFDLNGDGSLSREEMFMLLKNCLPAKQTDEDPEEGVKDLVDQTLKIHDKEQDPKLSKEEYGRAAEADWLTIELFGPCLPSYDSKREFLESVSPSKRGRGGSK